MATAEQMATIVAAFDHIQERIASETAGRAGLLPAVVTVVGVDTQEVAEALAQRSGFFPIQAAALTNPLDIPPGAPGVVIHGYSSQAARSVIWNSNVLGDGGPEVAFQRAVKSYHEWGTNQPDGRGLLLLSSDRPHPLFRSRVAFPFSKGPFSDASVVEIRVSPSSVEISQLVPDTTLSKTGSIILGVGAERDLIEFTHTDHPLKAVHVATVPVSNVAKGVEGGLA